MEQSAKHSYEFGAFQLDTAKRLLWRDGEIVSLMPKAFDVLLLLRTFPRGRGST